MQRSLFGRLGRMPTPGLALRSVALLLACAIALPAFATTYTFTSPSYSFVIPFTPPCTVGTCVNYTTSMNVAGSFTTAAPLAANLLNTDVRGAITSYSFNDGLNKARQVLDKQAVSVNLNYLGRIAAARGDVLEAEDYFRRALNQAVEINDRLDQGVNLGYLGRIARERGFLADARGNFRHSLKVLREVEDHRGRALILAQVALLDMKARRFVRARWRIWRSLRLIRKVGDKRSEGTITMYLGQIHIARGKIAAARACLNWSLQRARRLQDHVGEAEVQLWLGRAAEKRGEVELARSCYDICRTIVAAGGSMRLWKEADSSYHALNPSMESDIHATMRDNAADPH